jgi:hypothetical protein
LEDIVAVMKGRPDGVHNFSVTKARAHAMPMPGIWLASSGGFSGVSTRVSSAESLRPSAARMSVSCAVNRRQNWATPWKSCEDERAAVSVIDEQTQTRLDTFAQRCKGGWRVGIASSTSSSSSGGSSLGITDQPVASRAVTGLWGCLQQGPQPLEPLGLGFSGEGQSGTWSLSASQVPIGALPHQVLQPTIV